MHAIEVVQRHLDAVGPPFMQSAIELLLPPLVGFEGEDHVWLMALDHGQQFR